MRSDMYLLLKKLMSNNNNNNKNYSLPEVKHGGGVVTLWAVAASGTEWLRDGEISTIKTRLWQNVKIYH